MQFKRLVFPCCVALLLIKQVFFCAPIQARENLDNKAQLTAAFIYQITKFTFWPNTLNAQNPATFTICVLGQSNPTLLGHLRELESKSTQGQQIEVVQRNNTTQLLEHSGNHCKVLFATDEQWQGLSTEQIAQLTLTTLLIGNSKDFLQQGGMLALLVIDNKMKIFINTSNLEKTPIRLESRLKALAKAF